MIADPTPASLWTDNSQPIIAERAYSNPIENGAIKLQDLFITGPGDADLDGEFATNDLIVVMQAGQYEDQVTNNSDWEQGDWNGDRDSDSGDLVFALQFGGYNAGSWLAMARAVPEPSSWSGWLGAALLACNRSRRRISR